MLTPEQYAVIGDSMTGLFQDLEDFIIQDFIRRVTTAGTITETAKWQALRAKEMGLSTEAIRKAVKSALQLSDKQLDYLFDQWGTEALKAENTVRNSMGMAAVDLNNHAELKQIYEAVLMQTKGNIKNITQSLGFAEKVNGKIVFNSLAAFYQKQLDFVQLQVASGALDYNTAIRQAVKRMADSGVRSVDYASGWSNHLDVAVRRATLTGANQLSGQMTDALGEEMGCNFVEVTAHAGARNTGSGPANHASWQGKVYCRKGSTKKYPNLAKVTGFGTGPGLKGWNCQHDYSNFWPGISVRTWTDEQLKNIDPPPFIYKGKEYDFYKANQHQREIERSIRKTKRELIGYNAADDTEAFTTASVRLRQQKKEYQSFSKAADLRMQPERHRVYDFGKGISQKAVQANKAVEKAPKFNLIFKEFGEDKTYIKQINKALKKEPDYYHVVLHSDGHIFGIRGEGGLIKKTYTPEELCDIIKNKGDYKGQTIKLNACKTASKGADAAQKIADIMGVNVKAARGDVALLQNAKGDCYFAVLKESGYLYEGESGWKIIKPKAKSRKNGNA